MIKIRAYAKINWFLDVVGRRPDGYHLLRMIMQKIDLSDILTLQISNQNSFTCDGDLPADEGNLVVQAWQLLQKELGLEQNLAIKLEKKIPVAAGLGGGSADAAALLKGANQLLNLGLSDPELAELGLSLGADIPFCLSKGPALVEGIGEKIQILPDIPSQYILLVNPGFPLSTRDVYTSHQLAEENFDPQPLLEALSVGRPERIGPLMTNALTTAAAKLAPVIKEIRQSLADMGLWPLLSGSGPTVFALAESKATARIAVANLGNRWPFVRVLRTL
ncbi:MAG: 4-(cytidine 5'-diphospho)-2-C-methyl-D-erythritol kinase [Clostridiales bacterium]|jgi:4-diphosphocytidyl-2-C-methyl-D-erythritol kinase|nr:4-(cytidine 5'-diphospho)-2-C-methyl-D-erythritol kinase [Clostridiales bacterium]